jgi:hypothetical protein
MRMGYVFWADVLAAFHFGYVAFVVVGQLLILIGLVLRWKWVRNPWFRSVHLLAIAVVAAEAIFHMPCPLTIWEDNWRTLGGQTTDSQTFVERLVHFFFMDGDDPWPSWVYEYLHIGFGVLVLLTFVAAPPRFRRRKAAVPPTAVPDSLPATS